MLIPVTYPSMLGAEAPYSNSGKLRTNGFELTLNWTDKIGNVEYSAQFQLTDAVNKLVEYGGADTYKLGLNETHEFLFRLRIRWRDQGPSGSRRL